MTQAERNVLLGRYAAGEFGTRRAMFEPERTILLTTRDYLRQLEEAQRIQSADAVMEAVRQAGRSPPKRDLWSDHDPEVRNAVRAVIEQTHRGEPPKR